MPEPVPQKIDRSFDFTAYQSQQPTTPLPGQKVDNEYDRSNNTINDTIDFVRQAIDDDGKVRASAINGGNVGPAGPPGPPGPEGPIGLTGLPGPTGPDGPQGPIGNAGPIGPKGDSYAPDATGPTADRALYDAQPKGYSFLDTTTALLYFKQSNTNADWSAGAPFTAGPAGPQGPEGPRGQQGVQGPTGPQGPQGGAGIAGADGAPGPMGPTGPKGDKGDTGAQGVAGVAGPAGAPGAPGATGPAGPTGAPGPYANINILPAKPTPADADVRRLQSAVDGFSDFKISFTQEWTNYFKPKSDALYIPKTSLGTKANFWEAAAGMLIEADDIWASGVETNLGIIATGATVTPDLALGTNFGMALAGSCALAQPTHPRAGSGYIRFATNAANCSISYAACWNFPGGARPQPVQVTGRTNFLFYQFVNSGYYVCTFAADVR